LRTQATVGVGEADRQLLGALDDLLALLGAHAVGDLAAVDAVLHEQDLQLTHVVHQELLESGGQHVAGELVRSVTDVGHQILSLEAATHSVVDTFWLAPFVLRGNIS